jgi:diguanylate cyclase (GGDEF)-like protein/PAS domain S-box-containing protein
MAAVACLALALLTFYGLVRERALALNVAEERTQNLARVLEEHARQTLLRVHGRLVQVDDLLESLRHAERTSAALAPTPEQLLALLPSDRLLGAIEVSDANGVVVWSSRVEPGTSTRNIANQEYFLRHRRGADRELVFGTMEKNAPNGAWVLPVSRRISTSDGSFAGVIVASVLPSYFQAFYDSIDRGDNGFVTLFLASGAVAVTSPHKASVINRNWAQSPLFRQELPNWPTGTARQARDTEGDERLYSYRALNDYPVVVAYGLSMPAVLANWNESLLRNSALLLAAILTLIGVAARWTQQDRLRRAAEQASHRSDARLRAIFETGPECIKVVDAKGNLVELNPAGQAMVEADSLADVLGKPVLSLIAPQHQQAFADMHQQVLAGRTVQLEYELVGLKGRRRWMATHATLLRDQDQVAHLAVTRDITDRKQAELDLRIAAAAFEAQEGICIFNEAQVILRVNQAFTEMSGFSASEAVGQTLKLLDDGHHDPSFFRALWRTVARTGAWRGEVQSRRKNGEVFPQGLTVTAVENEAGLATHYVATFVDISQRRASEEKVQRLAFFDALTGLPNRRLLMDRMSMAMVTGARHKRKSALLFVDLDNFKTINDTRGHHLGDLLLERVATLLSACVRAGDTVARLGGDEFVVMLEYLDEDDAQAANQAEIVGDKILKALDVPHLLDRHECHCTASLGITLFGGIRREDVEEPLKRADLAMYQAKVAGRNTLRFFDIQMQAAVDTRAALESRLREAVRTEQFVLHYQAQVGADGALTGVEALVRWQPGTGTMVSPAEFIPLAEETGLIFVLGHWVLETACHQLAAWATRPERAHLTIAVNVSARQFHQPDFAEQVMRVLEKTGANPERLKLELTESLLVTDIEDVIAKMTTLKAQGVGFSLDDFGTGYSSLSYLKRLPLDQLKIDQGFVRHILTDANDAAIAKMVVALADSLGLAVIAEGVETAAQRDFLASQGCFAYQGYFFSRPLPIQAFEAYADQPSATLAPHGLL